MQQSRTIEVRGPPPPYVKVRKVVGGPSRQSDFPTKETFYSLARPNNPDRTPLTPQERALAVETIQQADEDGIQVGNTRRKLIWKEACPVGFGQQYARNSDQLSVTKRTSFPPVCTYEDCFSINGTETASVNPLCLAHLGPNIGYAVLEYQDTDAQGRPVFITHLFVKYSYANGQQMENLNHTCQWRHSSKPRGEKIRQQLFDVEDDADKSLAVWQTATMFRCIADPTLQHQPRVSLANGLEQELKDELEDQGLRIVATPINGPRPQFPFGNVALPQVRMRDLVSATHGVLYSCCDAQENYLGQTKSVSSRRPEGHADDTVIRYKRENNIQHPMNKIPLAVVPQQELLRMEQEIILCNFLAYLLRLQNPFDPQFANTTPYCLNLELNSSMFNESTWDRVNNFMQNKYGYRVDLLAYF